jgi:SAM-dependent methyltransferase
MSDERRSLSQFGGAIATRGDAPLAQTLAEAWRAASGAGDGLTHGFHAYPARAHPELVRGLVRGLSRDGARVLDPFCGSGTMLVEAFAAGRRALGFDVNGVAVRLAHLKSRRTGAGFRTALTRAARHVAQRGDAAARANEEEAVAELPALLLEWFAPHVARELDALGRAVDRERDAALHGALLLVLSSLLTKVSRREAETSESVRERRIASGFTTRLFVERTDELVRGLAALAAAARAAGGGAPPLVALADARALPVAARSIDLVVTSPPYAGTYDYGRIQELRALLLGIPLEAAKRREIGARGAAAQAPAGASARYADELGAALREMARVLAPDGRAVLILGDSRAGATSVRGDALVEGLARAAGLAVLAVASQERRELPAPDETRFQGLRREHLIALALAPGPAPAQRRTPSTTK